LAGVVLAQTRTFQRLVIADTAVGLAAATLHPSGDLPITSCQGRLEEGQVRLLDVRAGSVGSTTGRILEVGDAISLTTPVDAASVRFVKTGSTTGVLMVECGR